MYECIVVAVAVAILCGNTGKNRKKHHTDPYIYSFSYVFSIRYLNVLHIVARIHSCVFFFPSFFVSLFCIVWFVHLTQFDYIFVISYACRRITARIFE